MVSTFLFASFVNEKLVKPLEVIRSLPTEGWCVEVQRFFNQIKVETSFLSAKNFFIISRSALLALAGILVTYVLVLLQFAMAEEDLNNLMHCSS